MSRVATPTPRHRRSAAAVLLLGTLTVSSAGAAPEDDYQRGLTAFRSDDVIVALSSLRRAADQGHAAAQALLAYLLDRAEENTAALDFYRRAAEQGNADGMYGMAMLLALGEGTEKNPQEAVRWLERGSELGHGPSMTALAEALIGGDLGLTPDVARARTLLEKALAGGHGPARAVLQRIGAAPAKGGTS